MAESEFRKGKITISLHFYFKQKKKKDRDYLNTGLSSRFSDFFPRHIESQVGLIRK